MGTFGQSTVNRSAAQFKTQRKGKVKVGEKERKREQEDDEKDDVPGTPQEVEEHEKEEDEETEEHTDALEASQVELRSCTQMPTPPVTL